MTALARPAAVVAVVGGTDVAADVLADAEEVGRLLAQRGALVKTGGRGGVAEAACRGAVLAGGQTLGILPGRFRREANPFVTIPVPTGLGDGRNALVVLGVDAVIALPGSHGTQTEISFARIGGVPVVSLGGWAVDGVVEAADPGDAVDRALDAGQAG